MFGFFKKKQEESQPQSTEVADKKVGFIKSIFTQKKLSEQTLDELEEILIMSDVGVKASAKIVDKFSSQKQDKTATEEAIKTELAKEIEQILTPSEKNFEIDRTKKPYVILMIGVNGAGKTTTIGKLASKLKKQGLKISLIAGDTFRAAAVEQLKIWGERNDIRVFSGPDGCNAAGLAYDGINAAIKEKDDVVFIDTAGRLQNKTHLMEELKKINKTIKKLLPDAPHTTLLTLDSTTGQNALEQTKVFKEMIEVSGLVITKLDGTSKGGVVIAIAEETKTPIYYIGVGERIEDLQTFSATSFSKNLVGL
ncbi:MAG: signal recognition particle-docking protein FtsY [Alphaproteobacteria bacterium]|nr:signal recognition particle-docking protein FtsY [Alphaproteobacteria bacterium]